MNGKVRVSTREYKNAHGKLPKGYGDWWFDICGKRYRFNGTYSAAKKYAQNEAGAKMFYTGRKSCLVVVMP